MIIIIYAMRMMMMIDTTDIHNALLMLMMLIIIFSLFLSDCITFADISKEKCLLNHALSDYRY